MFECYKLVASFAGKSTVYSSEGKTFISPGYKEFLLLWKDKISSNSSILSSWISNTIDEIETLSKKLHDLQKELSQSSSDLLKLTCKLEDFNSEDFCSKQEQIRLRGQLESLMQKNESLQEVKNKEINSLKLEIQENQKELGFTFVENSKLKDQVNKLSNELMELKTASQVFRSTLKSSEEKMNLLKNEKNQLENYVKQVQITIGSNEVNKIQAEISRIQAELEVLERERLNFECQLLKVQTDPRMRDLNSVKDLNYKLTHTERLINNYKKTLGILLEDLQKEEMIQSLRSSQHENKNTEKRLVFPKSISVLTSRFSESTKNLRKKSPFE
jgi:DNA repair exonuclease SbcCD ATPase subunit